MTVKTLHAKISIQGASQGNVSNFLCSFDCERFKSVCIFVYWKFINTKIRLARIAIAVGCQTVSHNMSGQSQLFSDILSDKRIITNLHRGFFCLTEVFLSQYQFSVTQCNQKVILHCSVAYKASKTARQVVAFCGILN